MTEGKNKLIIKTVKNPKIVGLRPPVDPKERRREIFNYVTRVPLGLIAMLPLFLIVFLLNIAMVGMVLSIDIMVEILEFFKSSRGRTRTSPLHSLNRCADFFGLTTRKSIKAMAADFDVEIRRLRRERRPWAARWNIGLAWGYAIWFILRSPADWLLQYLIKSFRGN